MGNTIKRDFQSLAEAMAALSKDVYNHSVRVSNYIEVLFTTAAESGIFYMTDTKAQTRLRDEYLELAKLCGLYHDIGKAFVPYEYQQLDPSFSEEEVALYRKHTADGVSLIDRLFKKENEKYNAHETGYVKEAVLSHHEKWNGSGFPDKTSGRSISVLARMVAFADTLDNLLMSCHSETPVQDTIKKIETEYENVLDPEIINLIPMMEQKIKRIFKANASDSSYVPKTNMVIRRTKTRPFKLLYRPVADKNGKVIGIETSARFLYGTVWKEYPEMEELLKAEELRRDVGNYFLYEAFDTCRRLKNCGADPQLILMDCSEGWLNRRGIIQMATTAFNESGFPFEKLYIGIDEGMLERSKATFSENIRKLSELGCKVICDMATAEKTVPPQSEDDIETVVPIIPQFTAEQLKEKGVTAVRLDSVCFEHLQNEELSNYLKSLTAAGIELFADNAEDEKYRGDFDYFDIRYKTGALTGSFKDEDDYVRFTLDNENN